MTDNDVDITTRGKIMKSNLTQKLRQRRQARAFERALDNASPTMRNELIAMAARQNSPL